MKITVRKLDKYVIGGDVFFNSVLKEDSYLIDNLDPDYYDFVEVDSPIEDLNVSELTKKYCLKRYFYINNELICTYLADSNLDLDIAKYEKELASTDYIITKITEAQFSGADMSQYDILKITTDRQLLRDKINELRSLKIGKEYSSMYYNSDTALKFKL